AEPVLPWSPCVLPYPHPPVVSQPTDYQLTIWKRQAQDPWRQKLFSGGLLGYPLEDTAGVALKYPVGRLVAEPGDQRQETRWLAALVAARRRVFLLRRLGHGNSPRHSLEISCRARGFLHRLASP